MKENADLARQRLNLVTFMRLLGVATIGLGLFVLSQPYDIFPRNPDIAKYLGCILIAVGLAEYILLPLILRRYWSRHKPKDQ